MRRSSFKSVRLRRPLFDCFAHWARHPTKALPLRNSLSVSSVAIGVRLFVRPQESAASSTKISRATADRV
jgi:hypothetical protein